MPNATSLLAEALAEAVHDEDQDWEQAVDDGIG